ncbi:POTRA domain-containing protein [Mesorhizobium atlanticum]
MSTRPSRRCSAPGCSRTSGSTRPARAWRVKVSEYKVVNQALFQGNKKLKDNALQAAIQLKPRATFSQQALDADVEAVKAAYKRIGRDDAAVTTQIMDLGDNRVNVVFNINEGGRTQIAAINFVGNHAYSSRRLSDVINTKRSSRLSFVLRDDVYDEDKLRADQEAAAPLLLQPRLCRLPGRLGRRRA